MHLPFFIARRYLFSRKSHSAINIISAISAGGIALATMALICVLSVFNGFRDLIGGLYSSFDPPIEITPAKGKYAEATDERLLCVRNIPGVADVSEIFSEEALILYRGHPLIVTVKGVDDRFVKVTGVDSIVRNIDNQIVSLPPLHAAGVDYAIPGRGLAVQTGLDFGSLQICAPRKGERINMANPIESFNVDEIFSSGCYFEVKQKAYDESSLLTSIDFSRQLFEQTGMVSSLAVGVKPGADVEKVKQLVSESLGPDYHVRNRAEQHEDTFKIMKIEKLMAFFFLTFIVLVACFNLIGSVAMLIIDKKDNAATLRALGMTHRDLSRIFLAESRLITFLGAVSGIVLGLFLCWLQQSFGLLSLGNSSGNYIIDAYPVLVRWQDVVLVFFTVILVGFSTVWYPVRHLCRRLV